MYAGHRDRGECYDDRIIYNYAIAIYFLHRKKKNDNNDGASSCVSPHNEHK